MEFLENFGGIIAPILTLMVTILVPIIGAAVFRWLTKIGIDIEATHREALQSALRNAALLAVEKVTGVPRQTPAGSAVRVAVDAVTPDINGAIEYVKKSVPDAINNFGLDTNRIRDLLKPHITKALQEKTT